MGRCVRGVALCVAHKALKPSLTESFHVRNPGPTRGGVNGDHGFVRDFVAVGPEAVGEHLKSLGVLAHGHKLLRQVALFVQVAVPGERRHHAMVQSLKPNIVKNLLQHRHNAGTENLSVVKHGTSEAKYFIGAFFSYLSEKTTHSWWPSSPWEMAIGCTLAIEVHRPSMMNLTYKPVNMSP
jgi:hypothetical protein